MLYFQHERSKITDHPHCPNNIDERLNLLEDLVFTIGDLLDRFQKTIKKEKIRRWRVLVVAPVTAREIAEALAERMAEVEQEAKQIGMSFCIFGGFSGGLFEPDADDLLDYIAGKKRDMSVFRVINGLRKQVAKERHSIRVKRRDMSREEAAAIHLTVWKELTQ